MPTKPIEKLINRDLSKVAGKEIISIASPLLQELINFATNVYMRCLDSLSGEENEDAASLILYLHIAEMTDGVEVLISQGCSSSAIPLLRSSFEALLSIEYILETNYVSRSLAWTAAYAHERIKKYEQLDSSTSTGKEFARVLSQDAIFRSVVLPTSADNSDLQENIDRLHRLLARDQFVVIEAERKQIKKLKHRNPEWYSLFGGPSNLIELARHLKREGMYETLYRPWSSVVHAGDASRFVSRLLGTDDSTVKVIRNWKEISEISLYTSSFILSATLQILGKFRPREDYRTWYLREIRERYQYLGGTEP